LFGRGRATLAHHHSGRFEEWWCAINQRPPSNS
jgi:hypothetical protein